MIIQIKMSVIILLFVVNICTSYLIKHFSKIRFGSKTRVSLMKTCFPEENYNNNYNKKNIVLNPNLEVHNNLLNEDDLPLYTLIWYDCPKCKELINEMEELYIKYIYINGGIYFYDLTDVNSEFNNPILYKDDVVIGDNLFDIYEEIYKLIY
jgi:hypothetical protein